MVTDLEDSLDAALEQLRAGKPLAEALADCPAQAETLNPLLTTAQALRAVQAVEMPTPEAQLADRNEFLGQIDGLQAEPVSLELLVRLKGWIAHQIPQLVPGSTFHRKEQRRMSALLVKATLIFGMIFGSTGGAAALAANSLPDSPLYPAKLAMEQARLGLAADPAEQASLYLNMAHTRVQEMQRLALAGDVPAESTQLRLREHLNQALQLAAQLPEEEMLGLLTQARQMLQNQEQELTQTQTRAAEPAQASLQQASRLLNQVGQDVEAGLQDPQTFRWRHAGNRPAEVPAQPAGDSLTGGNPDCPNNDCEPVGDQNQYGPQPEQPGPGMPGGNPDCLNNDCQPVGDQNQYGPQPEQPGPGMPGGNPDCLNNDCEPVGDQNQYGPQPEQPGPGMPGGNPDCLNNDCQPVGDQNQYGPQPEQPGPGTPGGNPDCLNNDCEPVGDQNQNGPQPEQPETGASNDETGGPCTDCGSGGDQNDSGSAPEPNGGQPDQGSGSHSSDQNGGDNSDGGSGGGQSGGKGR
jgi:hypothetical protein